MEEDKDYKSVLAEVLEQAITHIKNEDDINAILQQYSALNSITYAKKKGKKVPWGILASSVDTIIANLNQNKYLFSIIATALTTKIIFPNIDIRNHQSTMENSYSNRSTDQTHVTPFLKKNGLTHCAASGMESGRNFERPLPLTLNFPAKPRGKGNKEATLGILHVVQ